MKKPVKPRRTPLFKVRHSPIHGYGVFAARRIRKGTIIIEYLGDRITHVQADARYEDKDPNDNHTFLFTVDARTVIDAGVGGNEARYINHGCDPNCESTTLKKRIFIEAIRTIQPGEELAYDYQIQRDRDDAPNVDEIFACRCGAKNCRGSMLEAAKPKKSRKTPPRAAKRAKGKSGASRKTAAGRSSAVGSRRTAAHSGAGGSRAAAARTRRSTVAGPTSVAGTLIPRRGRAAKRPQRRAR